jgi:hypothetical protein
MASELTVSAATVINRPLIEVFDRVCDVRRVPDWIPFCESCEVQTASTAPESHNGVGAGMKARFTFRMAVGLILDVTQEVTEFRWGRRLRFTTFRAEQQSRALLTRLVSPLIPRTALQFAFEPAQSGTVLTIDIAI